MTDIATLSVPITSDPRQIDQALARVEASLQKAERTSARAGQAIGQNVSGGATAMARSAREVEAANRKLFATNQSLSRFQQRQAADALTLARAQASVARESGDLAGAIATLQRATQGADQSSVAYLRTQQQLARYQREATHQAQAAAQAQVASAGGARSFAASLGSLGTALAGLGLGIAADQVARWGVAAITAGNQLEDVKSSLRIIARDQATYSEALRVAEQSQRLFGGSLAENVGDIQSFVLTSRTAGVALDDLVTVSRQLATLDPGQGLRGANIALRELLSGNPTSLAQRFELPRATLRQLTDESASTAEKLQALSTFLEDAGLSAEAVNARLGNTSQGFRDISAALSNLQASSGQGLGALLGPIVAELAQGVTQLTALIDRARGAGNVYTEQAAAAAAAAEHYEAYAAGIAASNAAINGAIQQNEGLVAAMNALVPGLGSVAVQAARQTAEVQALTRTQFAYAAALRASGVAAEEADTRARAQAEGLLRIETAIATSGGALDVYRDRLAAVATEGPAFESAIVNLLTALGAGAITGEQFALTLATLERQARFGTSATQEAAREAARFATFTGQAAGASRDAAVAATQDAQAKIRQAAETQVAAARQQELQNALELAASGSETSGSAAARLAGIYAGTQAPALREIIDLLREKASLEGAGPVAVARNAFIQQEKGEPPEVRAAKLRAQWEARYRAELTRTNGTTAQRLTLARQELATTAAYSDARITKAAEVARLETQLADEQARQGTGRLTTEQRAAETQTEKLIAIREDYHDRTEQAEEDYQERVLKIVRDYAVRQAAAQRSLQTERGADFYDNLTQSSLPQDVQQQLSAGFEAAFAQAQQYSQAGKAALAADYLALKQEQLQAEQRFQEALQREREKAAADGATAEERAQAENESKRLEAIKRLRDAELQARESNLLAEGDPNVAQRDEDLTAAQRQLQDDLAAAATRAGDATTEAQQRAIDKTTIQNGQLQTQLDLLNRIAGITGGGAAGAATGGDAAPAASSGGGGGGEPGPVVTSNPDVVRALGELTRAVRGASGPRVVQ